MDVRETTIGNVLTRTSGYLRSVVSHSLQPYAGCSFGRSLCGVACYVRHNAHLLRGREWGGFLEVRTNAAASYLAHAVCEAAWARRTPVEAGPSTAPGSGSVKHDARPGRFAVFLSSATEPFLPQESRYGITKSVLEAMCLFPPDELVVQTHSPGVVEARDLLVELSEKCDLRVHVSIESDTDRLPGLPPPASPVARRIEACAALRAAGLRTVVTVSPLLPIAAPDRFFARLAEVADAVVIDHFVEGDGSRAGSRTLRTRLPEAMAAVDPQSVELSYRDRIVAIARRHFPARVGVSVDGFAARYA